MSSDQLTTTEVAALKGVTRQAVSHAIKHGRLSARQYGRFWLVEREAAEAWRPQGGWPTGRKRK